MTRQDLLQNAAAEAIRHFLQACPPSSLPLSYLVEIISERDTRLLDDLLVTIEEKRRALRAESN
jgi:hypothetical protein